MTFEAHVMCIYGEEAGAVYGGAQWWFEYNAKGNDFTFSSGVTPLTTPGPNWKRAVGPELYRLNKDPDVLD
jgi:hypothetical protein